MNFFFLFFLYKQFSIYLFFQFRASTDRTWEETMPDKPVFAPPSMIPAQRQKDKGNDDASKISSSSSSKRSRWD